ncbi:MAG TPA: M14 family zinc carboxypeptidase [Pirellulales bacterium]|nr:M14 family zinc carboxypeptidase [Pirellulales bacterium]
MQRLWRWRTACAVGILLIGEYSLGRAQPPNQSFNSAQAVQAEQSLTATSGGWQVLTRSVEQRVIEYRQFGRGEQQILVIGPLEGDEPGGVELLERLVDHLERFPRRLDDVTVTVVRDPNPDGRLRGSRTNARGVRLDMNFPTRQWRKVPIGDRWLSGRTPQSEPETWALIELLDDVKPHRIVLLEATRREAELRYSTTAEPIARRLATQSELRPTAWDAAVAPAALATYAGNDRQLPTLVLRVSAAAGAEYNWAQYKRMLLAAIEPDAPTSHEVGYRLSAFSRDGVSAAVRSATRGTGQQRGRILSAKELELGGVLVPVVRQPRAGDSAPVDFAPERPATQTPATPTRSLPGGPPSRSIVPYRPKSITPGTIGTPVPYRSVNRFRGPSAAQTDGSLPVSPPNVERLPPVDPDQHPIKSLPRPIPLYPETGY